MTAVSRYNSFNNPQPYSKRDHRHHVCPIRRELSFVLLLRGFHFNAETGRLYVKGQWRVRCRCGHVMPTRWGFRDVATSFPIAEPKRLRYPYAPRALIHIIYNERSQQ